MDLTNEDIPSTRKVNYAGCAGDLTDLNGKYLPPFAYLSEIVRKSLRRQKLS